eukprot:1314597-Amorphochlora_amoeboformis.AAC.1
MFTRRLRQSEARHRSQGGTASYPGPWRRCEGFDQLLLWGVELHTPNLDGNDSGLSADIDVEFTYIAASTARAITSIIRDKSIMIAASTEILVDISTMYI